MNIEKHIFNTLIFYLDLLKTIEILENRQYIINTLFDLFLLDKNMIDFILKKKRIFYEIKYRCGEFLNESNDLPFLKEKMKLYNNIILELELKLLNNNC